MKNKTLNQRINDRIHTASVIAAKDIYDVVKNKTTSINLLLMLGIVVFFYWLSTVRPFDKRIDVIAYEPTQTIFKPGSTKLADGYELNISLVDSVDELERSMAYKELGLAVPPDFNQSLDTGKEATLDGYVLWQFRTKSIELENKFSDKFSQLLNTAVHVEIGENFIQPPYDKEMSSAQQTFLYATLFTAIFILPFLMLEEKQTKTLEALLVSPAGPWEVVLGKAMAGGFYLALISGWFFVFYWTYVTSWYLAFTAAFLLILFCIGLGLTVGNLTRSPQHINLIGLIIAVLLLIPAMFANEPFLNDTLKIILPWFPSTVLSEVMRLSFSSSPPVGFLIIRLAVALVYIILIFTIVIWQVRRSDRMV
jgi:ABC-2 type transport system permease protein